MTILRLPGLIDPHVHVRDLGQSHKEDWDTATAAALAGGLTLILAMPNTQPPIADAASLAQQQAAARARARCDYGLHLGAGPDNVQALAALAPQSAGLKLYLDQTFGPLRLDSLDLLAAHAAHWPAAYPLLAHAESRTLAAAILAAHLAGRSIHICHVSRKAEIELIAAAKSRGISVTCEVCPHHLFLIEGGRPAAPWDRLIDAPHMALTGGYSEVRPRLAAQEDVDALWARLDAIDCFATDHAPHTRVEKESAEPPPGFPGLETALGLWLTAVHAGRLGLDDVVARMHTAPRRIFGLPEQANTWIEIDAEQRWTVKAARMLSRCAWSPFEGWQLTGRVIRTTLRGQPAYDGERVAAPPGSGQDISQMRGSS